MMGKEDVVIEIDSGSGFCFGVVNAINKAELELRLSAPLYCLGDIVHNGQEVKRLAALGLQTIDHEAMRRLHGVKVLLRAHGEPPSTYRMARENGITVIDASCPVVLMLQKRIRTAYEKNPDAQIVIYGKNGHAEVLGLVGQTDGKAIVVEGEGDLYKIDLSRPVTLFSQTTKSVEGFNALVERIKERMAEGVEFRYFDTICRQVANRIPHIRSFAARFDVILFVSGAKSSNGKVLLGQCRAVNPRTYLVSEVEDIDARWIVGARSIGVCGATSTPKWLMEEVAMRARQLLP